MPKAKKWLLKEQTAESIEKASQISKELGISPVTASILYGRGYGTPKEAEDFLKKENTAFHSPFLMKDMEKGVKRVLKAVKNKEHITVYGDYDVDGVTATSTLMLYIRSIGGNVDYYIPNRANEGYGLNNAAVDTLKERGTDLIITVDTGITAIEETEYIKSLGMGIVVTDHHKCQEILPDAEAVINHQRPDCPYPFKELAGVGVVFKLITAIEFTLQEMKFFPEKYDGENYKGKETYPERISALCDVEGSNFLEKVCSYIDLVAIGTVADVMMLKDENRLICAMGIKKIESSARVGLKALIDAANDSKNQRYPKKRKITTSFIGFTIAPRINAAGRIADASIGVELFTTDDEKRAAELAETLCKLNVERQLEETRIEEEAEKEAEKNHDFANDPVMVLAKENWHHGVIGIVSSRLTEKYNLPSILISIENGIGKGSGRSIKGLNLVEALNYSKDLLVRYGGHELAAGLTIETENIDEFKKKINEFARQKINPEDNEAVLDIDCEIHKSDINIELAEELSLLEPYGVGNPQPIFEINNLKVTECVGISGNKHTKLTLDGDITALLFGVSPEESDLKAGDVASFACRLDVNEFRNVKTAQIIVVDSRIEGVREAVKNEIDFLKKAEKGGCFRESDELLPTREDFAAVYKNIRAKTEQSSEGYKIYKEKETGEIFSLYRLYKQFDENIRMAKIKLILEILADVGLISLNVMQSNSFSGSEIYEISIKRVDGKVNLFGTPRYKAIKKNLIK